MAITSWPKNERPREKLFQFGAKHLSDAELLAIFLRTGTIGKTALDIARECLSEFGSLKKLLSSSPQSLYQVHGLGKAKIALLKAVTELGLRYQNEAFSIGEILNNTKDVKRFLSNRLKDYPHEVFACLFLDSHHRMLCFEELFAGTINETSVYPREIVKRALSHNAAKVILAHNHPSGNPNPSAADLEITWQLRQALALVDIQVIDHIIVGSPESLSLTELGHL